MTSTVLKFFSGFSYHFLADGGLRGNERREIGYKLGLQNGII
jgi:hypothetical protein